MYRKSVLLIIYSLVIMLNGVKGSTMVFTTKSLNGLWQLQPGKDKPGKFDHVIQVPSLVDIASPALKWDEFKYFWYKKDFVVPENLMFKQIYLQLEQVKYGTKVWINGQLAGGDIPCYTSQEFDLTPFVKNEGINELLIRVGVKQTLPESSPVGNDFEKLSFIPGIWGDVSLRYYDDVRIKWTQIIPDINKMSVTINSEFENLSEQLKNMTVHYQINENNSGKIVSESDDIFVEIEGKQISTLKTKVIVPNPNLWLPENPFLYQLNIEIVDTGTIIHQVKIPFGMREFKIKNGNFYLNGNRRVLMGGNICFHRMLSDETRNNLPWQVEWIKKVFIDIPKSNNMHFFRFHLGHAYNKWYDLADQYGIMLQDEWMFWTSTGSEEQIENEFKAWIKENCNHPSIVIWDALNESEDVRLTKKLIPKLKKLDPTRPWEMVDFPEDHPYIYSLGPVLHHEKFGYSRSINNLTDSKTPTMVNEYMWWWLDQKGDPTPLTEIVVERWLGKNPTKHQLLEHQVYLASELTELWRRMDLDAIMPFVYLSINTGATANWFFGPLKDLKPKPVLNSFKNAISPVGISIELWDRHFVTGEARNIPIYIFNDTASKKTLLIQCYFSEDSDKIFVQQLYTLDRNTHKKIQVPVYFNLNPGHYELIAKICDTEGTIFAESKKPIRIYAPLRITTAEKFPSLCIADPDKEINYFIKKHKLKFTVYPGGINSADVVMINSNGLDDTYKNQVDKLTDYVKNGGILIIQEPEYRVSEEREIKILRDLELHIVYRDDPDRGGYDSYVFPENDRHLLWKDLDNDDFKLFNGGWGGEIVSQYNLHPTLPFNSVANCNLSLKVPAVMEIPYGKGWVIISRIQFRGRLKQETPSSDLFDRRYDPVAEQYLWNLLTGYVGQTDYHSKIRKKISDKPIFIARVKASSGQIYDALDGKLDTRWASKMEDPQWVWIDLGHPTKINKITMHWEVAYGKQYSISVSDNNEIWKPIYEEKESDGGIDVIDLDEIKTRYLKIEFLQRGTQWGYSIWELLLE